MTCLAERREHQRDRASNIMLEMGDVVRRCGKLPCHDVTARISIATQVNDTLHEPLPNRRRRVQHT